MAPKIYGQLIIFLLSIIFGCQYQQSHASTLAVHILSMCLDVCCLLFRLTQISSISFVGIRQLFRFRFYKAPPPTFLLPPVLTVCVGMRSFLFDLFVEKENISIQTMAIYLIDRCIYFPHLLGISTMFIFDEILFGRTLNGIGLDGLRIG